MGTARLRSLLATTAVAARLLHGLSGHAAVLCLLLATVVTAAAIARPRPSRLAIAPLAASYVGEPPMPVPCSNPRAKGSRCQFRR